MSETARPTATTPTEPSPGPPEGRVKRPRSRRRRRLLIGAGVTLVLLGGLALTAALLAPRLGPWLVKTRVIPALEKRFHRSITVGAVEGGLYQMELRQVSVRGPHDCPDQPLFQADRVRLTYDFWPLLSGRLALRSLTVERPRLCLRRDRQGQDNLSDILRRLQRRRLGHRFTLKLSAVRLTQGALKVVDETRGARLSAPDFSASLVPGGESQVTLRRVRLQWPGHPPLHGQEALVRFRTQAARLVGLPRLVLRGVRLRLHEHLVLTDIGGSVTPQPDGWVKLDLVGSYGGVGEALWTARGRVQLGGSNPLRPRRGHLTVTAEQFTLDKLAPILKTSLIPNPAAAQLGVNLKLALDKRQFTFSGKASLSGLTVTHPYLARQPVENLGFQASIRGRYLRAQDLLQIPEIRMERQGVTVLASAEVYRLRKKPRIKVRLELPRVRCARVLRAIPRGLAPRLQSMRVSGWLSMRLSAEADFKYLTTNSVTLDGHVDHRSCKVVSMPWELSAERLRAAFGHEFSDAGQRFGFEVGPENPDYVPLDQISLNLQKAILTTEDSRFYHHHGFIPREFQTALARNLIARRFVFGASSITMQMVKNVLLGRRKTIARKLQELILTWYLERHLTKKRILEIYLNVIEFGPGIFGIGRAAWHLFGKDASELAPQEAAYLASTLPNPKKRYLYFCRGKVPPRWRHWVDRILRIMHKRGRLTDSELQLALVSPITFSDKERGTLSECLARRDRFLERRR